LEERKGDELLYTFGHSDEYFFNLWKDRGKNGSFILEKVSTDSLKVIHVNPFSFAELKNMMPTLAYPLSMYDRSFLIATAEDPSNEDIFILAFRIAESGEISPESIVLGTGNREAILAENGFLLFKSVDEKKAALFIPREKFSEKNEKFALRYFNKNFEFIRSKELEIPYSSGQVTLQDAVLTSRGVFHGIISLANETRVRITPDSYALLTYDPEQDVVREKSLALGNKWFYSIKLSLTPDTNLWLAGYYSNMVELSMAGSFSVVADSKTGGLIHTGLYPFKRDFRLKFRSDITRREDELGLFKLDDSRLTGPDRLTLISEKRYTRSSTIFNPATGTYSIVQIFNYDEILISTLLPSSKIVFNGLIPKYQSYSSEPGRFTSYLSVKGKSNVYLFYNDHVKNQELSVSDFTEYRQLNNENNMTLTYCIYDGEQLKRISLNPDRLDAYYLDPGHYYETTNGLVLMTYNGYRIRYMRVEIP
jgi:hypothetical protein